MALDSLQCVIEKLQKTIEAHRSYLAENETRTRQVLIDPLLRELGWDVSDPDMVELEYKVGQQRADYALISNGRRVALIEAKRLGSDLQDDEIMQVLNYANRAGIGYMIITNGDRWEMYEVFQPAALEERLLMKLELSQQPAHRNALQALAMWKPNLAADGGPSEAAEAVLISDESSETLPSDDLPTEEGTSDKKKVPGKKPPTRLAATMPDGERIDRDAAIDTFVEVIEKLGIDRVRGVFPELNMNAQTNTQTKKQILERVADRLGEQLEVKIVPKN